MSLNLEYNGNSVDIMTIEDGYSMQVQLTIIHIIFLFLFRQKKRKKKKKKDFPKNDVPFCMDKIRKSKEERD